MNKKLVFICSILLFTSAFLCGCGSMFDKQYVEVNDYVPSVPNTNQNGDKIVVKNYTALKRVLQQLVYSGASDGDILFDPTYDGNAETDMVHAIQEIRTQDALCAYCVKTMSADLNRIVTFYEAKVNIVYAESVDNIIQMTYAVKLRDSIKTGLEENKEHLRILVSNSLYTTDDIKTLVENVYRSNPTCSVTSPKCTVLMYSGKGNQRLYEITLDYGLEEDEIIRRKSLLRNLDIKEKTDASSDDELLKVYKIEKYLVDHTAYLDNSALGTVYDALVMHEANDEGIALSFVEMAHQLGLEAKIVYGQREWKDRCWNVVTIEGSDYHIDVTEAIHSGMEKNFIKSDSVMWINYRWDTSSYPSCSGVLTWNDLNEQNKGEEPVYFENSETDPNTESSADQESALEEAEQPKEEAEKVPSDSTEKNQS